MSVTTTRKIRIRVAPSYVPEESEPDDERFLFAYHVNIENIGDVPVRLISRHWIITDGDGDESEVRGQGVVGEQPHLQPGEKFEYTSACPLPTPVGTMQGSFQMITDTGDTFEAMINPFTLAQPGALN